MEREQARQAIIEAVCRLNELAHRDEAEGEAPCLHLDMIVEGVVVGLSEDIDRSRDIRDRLINEIDMQLDLKGSRVPVGKLERLGWAMAGLSVQELREAICHNLDGDDLTVLVTAILDELGAGVAFHDGQDPVHSGKQDFLERVIAGASTNEVCEALYEACDFIGLQGVIATLEGMLKDNLASDQSEAA